MQDIVLKLTLDEANLVLEALGNLPFARVYSLIGKVQAQAGEQLKPPQSDSHQFRSVPGPARAEG